ncbi:MAG: hypothetical protein ACK5LJ_04825 [Paracoccus sp. (in: a-proteobacteria)]
MEDHINEATLTSGKKPDPQNMPEIVSDAAATGITIRNRTGVDCIVAVANHFTGLSAIGYARDGGEVTLPAGWAWWDVYALKETLPGREFIRGTIIGTIHYSYMKSNVGYRDTVTFP